MNTKTKMKKRTAFREADTDIIVKANTYRELIMPQALT